MYNSYTNNSSKNHKTSNGFTIIELLVVIVIIGILVAITSVVYNGVVKSAREASVESDLKNASTHLELSRLNSTDESYPDNLGDLKASSGNRLELSSTSNTYCVSGTSSFGIAFHITEANNVPEPGVCDGHQDGGSTDIANNSPIYKVSSAQCNALPVYTGANIDAIKTLKDDRDGADKSYRIAKLADNKCWMLDNLRLGNTSGTTILTPQDTNVTANFTLPQVKTSGTSNYDAAQVAGPVPGDTSSGATNYGYLYTWPAATAGETQASLPGNGKNNDIAPNSICPKNWRLPTGGASGDFVALDRAFGGSGVWSSNGPSQSKWINSGPFKGVFSGGWRAGVFTQQGSWNYSWTSLASVGHPNSATYAYFSSTGSGPSGNVQGRGDGYAIRCILN